MERLTPREEMVVEEMLKGSTNKEIGGALVISESTVKAHITHILYKLKCKTRTGAVAFTMRCRMGLLVGLAILFAMATTALANVPNFEPSFYINGLPNVIHDKVPDTVGVYGFGALAVVVIGIALTAFSYNMSRKP